MSVDVEALSINHLTAAEKMSLIGILWDSLGEQVNAADIPDWHRTELDRRLADLEANPNSGRPWEDVLSDLLKKRS